MSQSNTKSMFTVLPGAARIEVDDIEIEDNEENLKVSPYLYHDGMYFKCNDVIALFAFSIRQDPQWSSRYLMLLRNLRTFMGKHQIKNASIMVIVESEWFSMACERVRCCENDLKNLDVFYATDVSFVTENDVFNRLIDVLPANDYSKRSIFRLNIRNSEQ